MADEHDVSAHKSAELEETFGPMPEAQRPAFDDVADPYRTAWVKPPAQPAYAPPPPLREGGMPPIAGFSLGFLFGFIALIVAWARNAKPRTTRWMWIGFGVRGVLVFIKAAIEQPVGR